MANEITITIRSDNRAKPGMDDAARDTQRLQARMKELGAEYERTSKQTDDFGQKLHNAGNTSEYLNLKIGRLRNETRLLNEEFQRTGHTDFEHLFKTDEAARDLEKLRDQLDKTFGDSGKQSGTAFKGGFVSSIGGIALAVAPALAPMAVVLVAQLLAATGGALAGAGGLSAIVAGAVTQIKTNPQVRAAATDFGHWFSEAWKGDTAAFAKPTEDAIRLLKTELRGPMADLRADFEVIAPYTRDFANSLGIAAQKFMPGLNALLSNSGPLIQEIGHDVEMLATAGSDFLMSVSRGGKGEAEALDTLVRALVGTIEFTGQLIHWSAELYDGFLHVAKGIAWVIQNLTPFGALLKHLFDIDLVKYIDEIGGSFDDTGSKIDAFNVPLSQVGLGAKLTADDFAALTGKLSETAQTSDVVAGKISDSLFNSLLSADKAALGLHESATKLTDTLAKNGRAIDEHTHLVSMDTAAGQANREAVLARIEANIRQYDTDIAAGLGAQQAAQAYDQNTQALQRQLQKAGFTADQIDNLIGKYRNVPDKVDTNIATYGLTAAIDSLSELLSLIYHVQNNRIIDIEVRNRINTPGSFGHASGGVLGAGWTTLAEQGRELVRMPGAMVLSNPDTERALAGGERAAGGGTFRHTFDVAPGADSGIGGFLMKLMRDGYLTVKSQYVVG